MFKSLLALLLLVLAFAPTALASDGSSTHSTRPQDHMLSVWHN